MKFRITVFSRINYLAIVTICVLVLIPLFSTVIWSIFATIPVLSIIVDLLSLLCILHFSYKYSLAEVSCYITEKGLHIEWIKKFLLFKYKDKFIEWSDMQYWKLTRGTKLDRLKIALVNRSVYFEHQSFKVDDDFDQFIKHFDGFIQKYNSNNPQKNIEFRNGTAARIFLTRLFIIVVIISTMLIVKFFIGK